MRSRAAILAVLLLFVLPVSASANYQGQPWIDNLPTNVDNYHWSTANGGQWVDDRCGTSGQKFKVALFRHTNYRGDSVRVCHKWTKGTGADAESDWCQIPLGAASNIGNAVSCYINPILTNFVSSDEISSINLIGGFPNGKCFRIFWDKNHGGPSLSFSRDIPDLSRYSPPEYSQSWNDNASSADKVGC